MEFCDLKIQYLRYQAEIDADIETVCTALLEVT